MATAALTALLKTLSLDSDQTEHEAVLKACNDALREHKGSVEVQHARVVALLKLDRFEDALRQLDDGGAGLKQRAQLEHAYALYKQGELQDAREVAKSLGTRAGKHLVIQASYRLEDFETAARVLVELQAGEASSNSGDDSDNNAPGEGEENDLRINSTAIDAQLTWQRKQHLASRRRASREDLEAFETAFNTACSSIARGDLRGAALLLKRAQSLCQGLADLSKEEKQAELFSIHVQQLFVHALLGDSEQVTTLVKSIETDKIPDSSTTQIAQINRIAATKDTLNPYLASRILKAKPRLPPSDQFFEYQQSLFHQNEVALDFLSGKFPGIESQTSKKLNSQPETSISPDLNASSAANAAAHAQLTLGKEGVKSILSLLRRRPHNLGLVATLVQLYLSTGNHGAAVKVVSELCNYLENSGKPDDLSIRYAPGLVAILVSLYSIEGRRLGIKNELSNAASYWLGQSKGQPDLMKAAGYALLRSGRDTDVAQAKSIFNHLHSHGQNDEFVRAGLAGSSASTDPASARKHASSLRPVAELISGIDVDALEAAGIPQIVSTETILKRKRAADSSSKKPIKKKRVRKSRLPKDYDPNKKVDPERWLPMRDRSYYRPKKQKQKNKGKGAASRGGAQGAIATDESASGSKPTPASATPSGGGGGSGGNKKNKKKNKK